MERVERSNAELARVPEVRRRLGRVYALLLGLTEERGREAPQPLRGLRQPPIPTTDTVHARH